MVNDESSSLYETPSSTSRSASEIIPVMTNPVDILNDAQTTVTTQWSPMTHSQPQRFRVDNQPFINNGYYLPPPGTHEQPQITPMNYQGLQKSSTVSNQDQNGNSNECSHVSSGSNRACQRDKSWFSKYFWRIIVIIIIIIVFILIYIFYYKNDRQPQRVYYFLPIHISIF